MTKKKNKIILIFMDRGIGIRDEYKEKVFNRFESSKTASTSGLGQSIETKELVGYTIGYLTDDNPQRCWQEDTGVLKGHRGNGLGYALKYQLLRLLMTETEVTHWTTWNATSNKAMLDINHRLGYKLHIKSKNYEIAEGKWKAFLKN